MKWNIIPATVLALILALTVGACGQFHHLPSEHTIITYKDSTILSIKDSVRITEKTRYKDMAWLSDSLKIEGVRSRMWAVADTSKNAIIGELQEDKVEERTKIIYKDRIQFRDSIQRVEVPVPVEVIKEVKVIPLFWRIMGIAGIAALVAGVIITLLRFGLIRL